MSMDEYSMRAILNAGDLAEHLDTMEEVPEPNEETLDPIVLEDITKRTTLMAKIATYTTQGYKTKEICEAIGLSRTTLHQIRNSEEYKEIHKILVTKVVEGCRTYIAGAGFEAVKTLVSCLKSPNEKVALQASIEILNRLNVTAPKEVVLTHKSDTEMTDDEMKELIKSTAEALVIAEGVGNE